MKAEFINKDGEVFLEIGPENALEDCALELFMDINASGTGETLNVTFLDLKD